jgi:NAD(P)-dependent dehydrogenase (short-subunit alcohol dehydrogenase family)
MVAQGSGGSVVSITSSMVKNPIGGVPCAIPMMIKGRLESGVRSLAAEYAKQQIRFNAVAPGAVETALHAENPEEFLSAPGMCRKRCEFLRLAPRSKGRFFDSV